MIASGNITNANPQPRVIGASPALHVVVLAGGVGKRFRPYSSDENPKQFLTITHRDKSMLRATLDRFDNVVRPDRIWAATNARYVDKIREQAPEIPLGNIIGEPLKKNTAPAIATAVHRIAERDEEAVVAVVPSDHFIESAATFIGQLRHAAKFALQTGFLVTFGIPPTWASPDYGYIELGEQDKDDQAFHAVKKFKEKPEVPTAERYLASGNFLWNSGMFVWAAKAFLDHLAVYQPKMEMDLDEHYGSYPADAVLPEEALRAYFEAQKSISIDYALMEPSSEDGYVAVMPFATYWSDVGTWEGLKRLADEGKADPPTIVTAYMEEKLAKGE